MDAEGALRTCEPMIRHLARRLGRRVPGEVEDLMQSGRIGVLTAVRGYRGAEANGAPSRFATYAYWCIRGAMLHYLRDQSHIMRVPRAARQRRPVQLMAPDDERFVALVGAAPDERMRQVDERMEAEALLRRLPAEDAWVLWVVAGLGYSQREAAVMLGWNQRHVSRIYLRALARVRDDTRGDRVMGMQFIQYGEQLEDGTVREIYRVPVGTAQQHVPIAKRQEYQDAVERGVNVSRLVTEEPRAVENDRPTPKASKAKTPFDPEPSAVDH